MRDKILDDTSCLSYYIFSDWHCSFVKRNKKKYFTCYVLLRQQIISAAKISAINEAATDSTNFKYAVLKMN